MHMDVNLYELFFSAGIAVKRAREMARGGKKDEARDWLRFIENSQIVSLLGFYRGTIPIDVAGLRNDLDALRAECHPEAHADHSSDNSEIRASLDSIAFGILTILKNQKIHHEKTTV